MIKKLRKCPVCGNESFRKCFDKAAAHGQQYSLYRCLQCATETIDPLPSDEELDDCYQGDYFSKRTDRGYDNYFSENIRSEIERVFRLNLRDLQFDKYEKSLSSPKKSLDIGCAAGYFVSYMKSRGWDSHGIEVSQPCADFARTKLNLNVMKGDYLKTQFPYKFDLITMWATIEHLPRPDLFIEKISRDLKPGGMLIISTCRSGKFNFKSLFGSAWRFYNFPEHVCFFTSGSLKRLLGNYGFESAKLITYGSGVGRAKSLRKSAADFAAKHFMLGDMMALCAFKIMETESVECEQQDQLKKLAVLSEK